MRRSELAPCARHCRGCQSGLCQHNVTSGRPKVMRSHHSRPETSPLPGISAMCSGVDLVVRRRRRVLRARAMTSARPRGPPVPRVGAELEQPLNSRTSRTIEGRPTGLGSEYLATAAPPRRRRRPHQRRAMMWAGRGPVRRTVSVTSAVAGCGYSAVVSLADATLRPSLMAAACRTRSNGSVTMP